MLSSNTNTIYLFYMHKGRGRIRLQLGPLTFLKIFLLEMIYSGRSQHSEPSYIIIFMSVFFSLYVNDLYTISMLTNSSNFSIINTAHIDLQNNWGGLTTSLENNSNHHLGPQEKINHFEYLLSNILRKTK